MYEMSSQPISNSHVGSSVLYKFIYTYTENLPIVTFILRTYDEYCSELTSGQLSWTPVHDSENFRKENVAKLNDRDYEKLKCVLVF